MLAIDTLKLARRLREGAGFTPEHAEAVAETFAEAMTEQVASKSDLRETELRLTASIEKVRTGLEAKIAQLDGKIDKVAVDLEAKIDRVRTGLEAKIDKVRTDLEAKIDRVRTDLEAKIDKLDAKIETSAANTKADILKWMFGALAAQTALIAGLFKLLH